MCLCCQISGLMGSPMGWMIWPCEHVVGLVHWVTPQPDSLRGVGPVYNWIWYIWSGLMQDGAGMDSQAGELDHTIGPMAYADPVLDQTYELTSHTGSSSHTDTMPLIWPAGPKGWAPRGYSYLLRRMILAIPRHLVTAPFKAWTCYMNKRERLSSMHIFN